MPTGLERITVKARPSATGARSSAAVAREAKWVGGVLEIKRIYPLPLSKLSLPDRRLRQLAVL